MYLNINEVKIINSEHTSICNLLCPQCARTSSTGKKNPNLKINSLTIDDYKRIFPISLLAQLKNIFFCGNYGDVVAGRSVLETVSYFIENNVSVTIYSNASLKTPDWWKLLANVLKDKGKVIFAIDGLEDTAHIYRVKSNWKKIMENVKSFIEVGGIARWDYLIFEHNQHQVEDAHLLAKELGFKSFNVKNTMRNVSNEDYKKNLKSNKTKDGKFGSVIQKFGSWENYINQTKIKCSYKEKGVIYIDHDQNLWPCCWVGAPMFFEGEDNIQKIQLKKIIDKYGIGFNSLKNQSIEEVLNHQWFQKDLEDSWLNKMNDNNFKLMTCGRTCGKDYKFSSGDKSNKMETKL